MLLTLLIPELLWPEPGDLDSLYGLSCPALAILLARSQRIRKPVQSLEAVLSELFGHSAETPCAPLRLLGELTGAPEAGKSNWLCCDPVHLRFHQERLILADGRSFKLGLEDSRRLADDLNAHLSDIGRFHVVDARRWYLHYADPLLADGFTAPPLSAVAGRSVERVLAENAQAKRMRRLFNDIQMILHGHPINQQRENEGRMTINSLWLWGAGTLPERRESRFDGVWSGNPLARGLAHAAGVPTHPAPVDAGTFLAHAAPDTEHLVVLEDLVGPVQYEDGEAYRQALARLEKCWFSPLRSALAAGNPSRLCIVAPTAYGTLNWECQRHDLWKLWKRPQTLGILAQHFVKK